MSQECLNRLWSAISLDHARDAAQLVQPNPAACLVWILSGRLLILLLYPRFLLHPSPEFGSMDTPSR